MPPWGTCVKGHKNVHTHSLLLPCTHLYLKSELYMQVKRPGIHAKAITHCILGSGKKLFSVLVGMNNKEQMSKYLTRQTWQLQDKLGSLLIFLKTVPSNSWITITHTLCWLHMHISTTCIFVKVEVMLWNVQYVCVAWALVALTWT